MTNQLLRSLERHKNDIKTLVEKVKLYSFIKKDNVNLHKVFTLLKKSAILDNISNSYPITSSYFLDFKKT